MAAVRRGQECWQGRREEDVPVGEGEEEEEYQGGRSHATSEGHRHESFAEPSRESGVRRHVTSGSLGKGHR
jgi:hypothetical protein